MKFEPPVCERGKESNKKEPEQKKEATKTTWNGARKKKGGIKVLCTLKIVSNRKRGVPLLCCLLSFSVSVLICKPEVTRDSFALTSNRGDVIIERLISSMFCVFLVLH